MALMAIYDNPFASKNQSTDLNVAYSLFNMQLNRFLVIVKLR